jgi:hypothetical protein
MVDRQKIIHIIAKQTEPQKRTNNMTSEADWIKEVSKTYLEEAYKTNAVHNAGKKPSYIKDKKEEVKEETEECSDCLQEQTLIESIDFLTEEQQELFALSFVDDLLENLSWEEIEALTEEQLEEGLMAKLKGYAGGALAAAKSAPLSQFVSKAKKYGAERTERLEKKEAETAHAKEVEKARGEAKGGVRKATDAELHAIVGKLGKSKGATNKAVLAKAQETLGKRAEAAAGKGLGGLVAKTRGLLGNKAAMRDRVTKMAERSKQQAGKVKVDAAGTVDKARQGYKKQTISKIQALRAQGKQSAGAIKKLQKTLPKNKKK